MKKICCEINDNDFIEVYRDGWVEDGYYAIDLYADSGRIILSPAKIRKLRKQLKRALKKIEGEKEEYKPGDSVYLADGDDEGDDLCKSPSVCDINLSMPVKLIEGLGSGEWKLEYEACSGEIYTGYAYEKSFGRRA